MIEKYFAESEQREKDRQDNDNGFVDDDEEDEMEREEEDSDEEADPMPTLKEGELVHTAAEVEGEDPYSNLGGSMAKTLLKGNANIFGIDRPHEPSRYAEFDDLDDDEDQFEMPEREVEEEDKTPEERPADS